MNLQTSPFALISDELLPVIAGNENFFKGLAIWIAIAFSLILVVWLFLASRGVHSFRHLAFFMAAVLVIILISINFRNAIASIPLLVLARALFPKVKDEFHLRLRLGRFEFEMDSKPQPNPRPAEPIEKSTKEQKKLLPAQTPPNVIPMGKAPPAAPGGSSSPPPPKHSS